MARVREFAGEPAASNDVDGLDVENPATAPATAPAVVDDGANEGEGKETLMLLLLLLLATMMMKVPHPQFGQKVVVHKPKWSMKRMQPPQMP